MPSNALMTALARAGCDAESLTQYRSVVLDLLAERVAFDAALFHALSPRVPLSTASVRGLDPQRLARTMRHWDDLAVALSPMRERANEALVVTDRQAFAPRSRARAAFQHHVAQPLQQRSLCMVHLIVRGHVVSAIALMSKRLRAFDDTEVATLQHVAPTIALGDLAQQQLDPAERAITPVRLVCRDQRLSPRQRELVEYVALGQTNDEIARALGLSPHSVRNHLALAFRRLGAANRADLIRLAVLTRA